MMQRSSSSQRELQCTEVEKRALEMWHLMKRTLKTWCGPVRPSVKRSEIIILEPQKSFSKLSPADLNSRYYSKVWHQEKYKVQYWVQFFSAHTHTHTRSHTTQCWLMSCVVTCVTWFVWSVVLHVTRNGKINEKEPEGKQNWLRPLLSDRMCVWLPSLREQL